MKKKVIVALILAVVLSAVASAAATARTVTKQLTYRGTRIYVNGKETSLKDANGNVVEPFIIDGTTYLPVRGVSESLGCVVVWDGEENRINIYGEKEYEKAVLAGDKNAFEKYYITDTDFIDYINNAKPNTVIPCDGFILTKDANSKITGLKGKVLLDVVIQDSRNQTPATDDPQQKTIIDIQPQQEEPESKYREDEIYWVATPGSDCFSSVGYAIGQLFVVFRESGKMYVYFDVSEDTWEDFRVASSLGSYFDNNIRDRYEYELIG